MKKYILPIAIGLLLSTALFSQPVPADTLLRRQMELDREFNPTLMDVQKINSLPALPPLVVQPASTNFSTWAGRATPPMEIAVPSPGTAMTEIPFQTRRGYIGLNAGNYANIDGAFGVRIVDNGRQSLGLHLLHNSTNGEVNFVQEDADPNKNRAFLMDNVGQLRFQHLLNEGRVTAHVSYLHSQFNYYGNTFGATRWFDNETQQLGVFNANVGLDLNRHDRFNVLGSIDVKNFNTLFGYSLDSEGIRGNEVDARIGFNQPFQIGHTTSRIGVDGQFFATLYQNEFLDNYSQIIAAPYIAFSSHRFNARLGADAQMQFIDGNRIRIVPNVDVNLMLGNYSSLYGKVHGGFQPNTFLSMMSQSRFIDPFFAPRTRPSFTMIDIETGVRIGQLDGFRFDIFGGFRQTDDEHFLIMFQQTDVLGVYPPPPFWSIETLMPVFANLSHSHIGGMIQSNIFPPLDMSLRVKRNFYSISNSTLGVPEPKAYGLPGVTADLRAVLRASNSLSFTLNYHFAGDRWSFFNGENVQMNNISDLNLGAMYRINDSFSLNVRANNVLFQNYDIWFGHPAQGFNASGGFTFKF